MKVKPDEVRRRGEDHVRDLIRTASRALENATKELDDLRKRTLETAQGTYARCQMCGEVAVGRDENNVPKCGEHIGPPTPFSEAELLRRLPGINASSTLIVHHAWERRYLSLARLAHAKGATMDEIADSAKGGSET
jgi:hypothetical protein